MNHFRETGTDATNLIQLYHSTMLQKYLDACAAFLH